MGAVVLGLGARIGLGAMYGVALKMTRRALKITLSLTLSMVLGWGIGLAPAIAASPVQPLGLTLAVQAPFSTLVAQSSPPIDQLRQQQQQIDQIQQTLDAEQQRLKKTERVIQGNLTDLQRNLAETQGELEDNQVRLQEADAYLRSLQGDLAQSQRAYQERQQATVARLQFLQRQRRLQGWAVLLQSDNLNQFLEQRYRIKRLYGRDRTQLQDLKSAFDAIATQQQTVEEQKNGIALLRQKLLFQKANLEGQTQAQKALATQLSQNRQALTAAQTQLERDSNSLRDLIQSRLRRSTLPGLQGGGIFRYPVNAEITSRFGWRVHPILGTERFHGGLDFGVDYGTPIGAAAPGTVIYADWYGGYGNAVVIDHGGGVTTLYAHNTELLVREGQSVQPGQAVAQSGSTGLSTGPHLHFEVRENGEAVDPLKYLER